MMYLNVIAPVLTTITAVVLALLLFSRERKTLLHKTILMCIPAVVALQAGAFILASYHSGDARLLGARMTLFSLCLLTPLCTRLALLWGKTDGQETLRRFRTVIMAQWLISGVFMALIPFHEFVFFRSVPTAEPMIFYGVAGKYFLIYLIISCVLILSIFEQKLRLSTHMHEIRVPTIVFMGIFVFFIIGASQGLLIGTLDSDLLVFSSVCTLLGFLAPTVFRFRNFVVLDKLADNRQAVYSSFMVLLVGAYLVFIGVIGKLFVTFGGDVHVFFSAIAALAITLIFFMVMTSFSVKERIRKFIDKTLYKDRFDYRAIWSRFSDDTAFILDLDELVDSILDTITDILDVRNGVILLTTGNGKQLNVAKKKDKNEQVQLQLQHDREFVDWLWRLGEPVRLSDMYKMLPDSYRDAMQQLRDWRASVCVPLSTKSGLVGIMVLAEKRNADYSVAEMELLQTLANHAALAIQNLRLQSDLQESRELESFYKLSSFVIHDLRNAVSILSMLAENAKTNMSNPEFRANLVGTLSETVNTMKGMLSRMSLAAKDNKPLTVERIDVVPLIKSIIKECIADKTGIAVEFECGQANHILADATQLRKVFVNLLLNAVQAMPEGGKLTVRTKVRAGHELPLTRLSKTRTDRYLEVTVTDTGVGMSEDFVQKKLFRPFQTTRRKGLGIGLFHCKEIVEDFDGKIWAESRVGEGTTFHLVLPAPNIPANGSHQTTERAGQAETTLN